MRILFLVAATALLSAALLAQGTSAWVSFGSDHLLHYRTDSQGNRIMDFSFAGYKGGGAALPVVPVAQTIAPVAGDNTASIQAAIDSVSKLPLDSHGFRGAVLLAPGIYNVAGTVTIGASGVVVRGSGSAPGGTVINIAGPPHLFLQSQGSGSWQYATGGIAITDAYVPAGANSFHVSDASRLHAGDAILVRRPITDAWIHFMGMDTLVRDGSPQTWLSPGGLIKTDRVIQSISGNQITLDVPLTDSFDSQYLNPPGPSIAGYAFPGRISEAGVEGLRVIAPGLDAPVSEPQYTALVMDALIDGWARDIVVQETENSITIGYGAKRVTLDNVAVVHTVANSDVGGASPADFIINGTQILVNRCASNGKGSWPFTTESVVTGPIVVLNFASDQPAGIAPHQRWATGLLADNAYLPNATASRPGIAFLNATTAGTGHGWVVGWAVAWNVMSPYFTVQQPPGAVNWCIGCVGKAVIQANTPGGIFDSPGVQVVPASLYLEQLRERLGDRALANIGYGRRRSRP